MIAVGTTTLGGTGTRPKVEQAVLFLWDYGHERKAWEGTLTLGTTLPTAFNALATGPDGRLFGTAIADGQRGYLFAFDPVARSFTDVRPCPEGRPLDLGLQLGPNGRLYGFTSDCLYTLDPDSLAIDILLREEGTFHVPGPIMGSSIYFATKHWLRAATIF